MTVRLTVRGTAVAAVLTMLAACGALAAVGPAAGAGVPTAHDRAPAATRCPLHLTATVQHPTGTRAFTMCSGLIPSFDGTPLDSDLSLPPTGRHLPLVVMLNGWGSSKTDFEATSLAGNDQNTWHWNNVWFVEHGFAVLNYTVRGFHRSCGKDPATHYSYTNDPACSGRASWTHLADRRWEIHDAQFLVGRLVDAGVANPRKIVVTGDSYGGGQSWLLALSQDKVMSPAGKLSPWRSPKGVPIHLAAAIPQYPWTDLLQALIDNGRGSVPDPGAPAVRSHLAPTGVEKESYVDGLYADGEAYAQYSQTDKTADLPGWFAEVSKGEPYTGSMIKQAIYQIVHYRSPYYMPVPGRGYRVPVLDIQGLTDPLFPAVQAVQEMTKLVHADASYPVWAVFGDLGHAYAGNPHGVWVAVNDIANRWLSTVLAGHRPSRPRFTALTINCLSGQPRLRITAGSFGGLATGAWRFRIKGSASTNSTTPPGKEASTVDPIVNGTVGPGGCRTMSISTDKGVAAWTLTPPAPGILIGGPTVRATVAMTGTNAEVAVRLWDLNPKAGTQTLITRAIYRLQSSASSSTQHLVVQLWPTAWPLLSGHRLKLEVTQNDSTTWRADNEPSMLTFSDVRLVVPERALPK
jgi:acetyl esterase/lipase